MPWGFHYPLISLGTNVHNQQRSVPLSDLHYYKDNDRDHNAHEDERCIKSGAENVTDQLATGHGEEHEYNAQSN